MTVSGTSTGAGAESISRPSMRASGPKLTVRAASRTSPEMAAFSVTSPPEAVSAPATGPSRTSTPPASRALPDTTASEVVRRLKPAAVRSSETGA